ncbi:MAG: OsmC family protein [Blastocatellia bacterium]|nr:OsmC family protein [Blastocatellia bacterium]
MNEQLPYLYETTIEWTEARQGMLRAPGLPAIEVAAPPEFKGAPGIWTPEHLFTAAVSSCLMTTFLAIAELSKFEFVSFACPAQGKLEKPEGQGFKMTAVALRPRLVIPAGADPERARRILEKAEKNCLISNSIQARVTMEPEIVLNRA